MNISGGTKKIAILYYLKDKLWLRTGLSVLSRCRVRGTTLVHFHLQCRRSAFKSIKRV
jgi:hypothetical protein